MYQDQDTFREGGPAPSGARVIRRRYTAVGIVMALAWMGESNEPAWAHALRAVVILLMLPPVLLRTNRRLTARFYESEHPDRDLTLLIAARVLIVSAALVASFLLGHLVEPHAGQSTAMLAMRLLAVLLTIPWQIKAALRARASEVHPSALPSVSAPRLIAAKLTLITAALLTELLLAPYLPDAQLATAAGILIAAAALGPRVHTWLLVSHGVAQHKPGPAGGSHGLSGLASGGECPSPDLGPVP